MGVGRTTSVVVVVVTVSVLVDEGSALDTEREVNGGKLGDEDGMDSDEGTGLFITLSSADSVEMVLLV
jgi:anti-sigma regulatory factor (Ser/Thr protein kinase)